MLLLFNISVRPYQRWGQERDERYSKNVELSEWFWLYLFNGTLSYALLLG